MSAIKEKLYEQIEAGMRDIKLIPILFSTPMVQAILSGNKSMTRRKCKYQYWSFHELIDVNKNGITQKVDREVSCPYGQPGDVLWVRENFFDSIKYKDALLFLNQKRFYYAANNEDIGCHGWKPSIHMPFEACRIFLRVKEIRVERLQDISGKDCIREGIEPCRYKSKVFKPYDGFKNYFIQDEEDEKCLRFPKDSFYSLWISINGYYSYSSNPWVWAISFARITNANEIAAIRKQWNERRAK